MDGFFVFEFYEAETAAFFAVKVVDEVAVPYLAEIAEIGFKFLLGNISRYLADVKLELSVDLGLKLCLFFVQSFFNFNEPVVDVVLLTEHLLHRFVRIKFHKAIPS